VIFTGCVTNFSGNEMLLEKTGNYGLEEITISFGEIEKVEIEEVDRVLGMGLGAALLVAVVVVSFALFFGASGGIGN
jgi:hypothetical protein